MIVGFTGTQVGMSIRQKRRLAEILLEMSYKSRSNDLHHGDCVGADAEADEIARSCGFKIVVHPPSNPSKRAFCGRSGDVLVEARPYLVRNHDIVDETMILIAAPKSDAEELRSGTWATVRYARSLGRQIEILAR